MTDQTLNGMLCRLVGELVARGVPLEQARRQFERQYVLSALDEHDGNLTRAAEALGIHRNTLRNKISAEDVRKRKA